MKAEFCYSFPAIRGHQANRDFFTIMCPLAILPKLFIFDGSTLSPSQRAQRKVNTKRIPTITDYILKYRNEYVFSSLTASIDGQFEFISYDTVSNPDIGTLKISMDSTLLINDGQHRRFAIEEALKADPSLKNENISIVLFIDENLKRSQQMFSDLNKHAVNVTKSLGIFYDNRDEIAILMKELISSNNFLTQYIDVERSNLSKNSNKIYTISNLYNATKKLIGKNRLDSKLKSFIIEYWIYFFDQLYEFQLIRKKELSTTVLRDDYVIPLSLTIEAFGHLGNTFYNDFPNKTYKTYIKNINKINWNRSNDLWQNRIFNQTGAITKTTNAIYLTTNAIKKELNIELNDSDTQLENNVFGGLTSDEN